MSDFLLELGKNPNARKLIKTLGLPIPVPEPLRRARGPYTERELDEARIVVGGGSALGKQLAETLAVAGATPFVIGDASLVTAFAAPGEAYGRRSTSLEIGDLPESLAIDGLVFDATGFTTPGDLGQLHAFFHPLVARLCRGGRAVVLGRPADAVKTAEAAAAAAALEGFVRSLAKEIGKRGATAQLVQCAAGAEDRLPGVLRFVLSRRSAFMTGQPIRVSTAARVDAAAATPTRWSRPLEGKVALVTGAARGIGEATARLLAAEGAHVVCLDRPADDGPTSQVARSIGGSVLLIDLSDPAAAAAIADELGKRHGKIDIVVHNAGITRDKTLAKMSADKWDQAVTVNLDVVVKATRALLDGKVLRDGGRVICLSSVAGIAGNVGQTNYAASKAGIIGFVEKLAPELGKKGITVNAIAPGFIETRLTAAIPVMIREVGRRLSALGQGGLPDDIGQAILFLATPGASGITGNVLRVCGGALIGK
jgi:3-oxoacyl-[acyl-carrier protein] reductase